MPCVQLVCPHCEKPAEVQVASVTRSRVCPHCGRTVLLQVAEKGAKKARKALLVTAGAAGRGAGKALITPIDQASALAARAEADQGPKMLEGEAFERMKADPELRTMRRKLIAWVVLVVITIIGVSVWHYTGPGAEEGDDMQRAEPVAESGAGEHAGGVSSQLLSGEPSPAHAETPKGRLSFVTYDGRPSEAAARPAPPDAKPDPVKQVLTSFLAAEKVDALLQVVAHPGRVETAVRSYYKTHVLKPVRYVELKADTSLVAQADETPMLVVLGTGRQLQATVVRTPDGHVGVDWPSFVALSDMDWKQFNATRPTTSLLFRVMADGTDLYAGPFADFNRLQCIRLNDPHDFAAAPCFAYVERASPLGQRVAVLLREHHGPFPLTVRLRYPQEHSTLENQALLENIEAEGWYLRQAEDAVEARR